MNFNSLPFNWFDLALLIVVFIGLRQGRKHGMSEELPGLLKWLAIMFGCAYAYQPLGQLILANTSVFSDLGAYLMAYLAVAMIIGTIFAGLKSALGEKWVGAEAFGSSEYYLGMVSGSVRFACMLIAGLALLNARSYSSTEVAASVTYQKQMYGSTFFPTLENVQSQVFKKSLMGKAIKDDLAFLLIKPTRPEKRPLKRKETALP